MTSKMDCNFYNFYNFFVPNNFIGWILADKEGRKRISFYKKMKKHIECDLKEIERNKENDVEHLLVNKYYNIIIKGKSLDAWRVYFLKEDGYRDSYVAFPLPNGTVIVQKLNGELYDGVGAKEEIPTRSKFWFPIFAKNFDFVSNIKQNTSDKMFVYDWIMSHTNYEKDIRNNCTFDSNIYVNLNK